MAMLVREEHPAPAIVLRMDFALMVSVNVILDTKAWIALSLFNAQTVKNTLMLKVVVLAMGAVFEADVTVHLDIRVKIVRIHGHARTIAVHMDIVKHLRVSVKLGSPDIIVKKYFGARKIAMVKVCVILVDVHVIRDLRENRVK